MFIWISEFLAWPVLEEIFATMVVLATAGPGMPLPSTPDEQGIASRFGSPNDKWVGGNLYCEPKRRVNQKEHACAHRYAGYKNYPCGTILVLENRRTEKRSWCKVLDRGPYGANVLSWDKDKKKYTQVYTMVRGKKRKAWYVKIRKKDKPPASKCPSGDCIGKWRGYLDMSPRVSAELGHNGMEHIRAYRLDRLLRLYKLKKLKEEKIRRCKNRT